jgi:hypothetical protein
MGRRGDNHSGSSSRSSVHVTYSCCRLSFNELRHEKDNKEKKNAQGIFGMRESSFHEIGLLILIDAFLNRLCHFHKENLRSVFLGFILEHGVRYLRGQVPLGHKG